MRSTSRSDDGASAVEFALIVPILMAIVIGTVEFGYRYQQNIEYTNAAMQAARLMSIKNDVAAATAEVRNFTGNASDQVVPSSGGCAAGNTSVTVTVTGYPKSITGVPDATFKVVAKGRVRCE